MRYAYRDLGKQAKGTTMIVRWSGGAAAHVLLLDPVNFAKYRERRLPLMYRGGGRYRRPPAAITIPEDGSWYVVADLRGYGTFGQATVELAAEGTDDQARQEELIGAA